MNFIYRIFAYLILIIILYFMLRFMPFTKLQPSNAIIFILTFIIFSMSFEIFYFWYNSKMNINKVQETELLEKFDNSCDCETLCPV